MSFPESFPTERLLIRRLTEADFPELRRLHTDAAVMEHIGGVRSPAQTEAYLVRNLGHWREHGFGLWMVHVGAGGPVAGLAMLRSLTVEAEEEVEVGYSLHRPYWGRGLATEIASACSAHGYESLGLESLVAVTGPLNSASHHVLRKIGMAFERDLVLEETRCWLFRGRRPAGPGGSRPPAGVAA
ncbi:MAG: GNAT family N-acetyltransferase [Gemmatimonadales bacterium]